MIKIAILALFLNILFSCNYNSKGKVYNVREFKEFAIKENLLGNDYQADEKQAIQIAGAYIFATLQDKSFPQDYNKWGNLSYYKPICIHPSLLDTVFYFSNHYSGFIHRTSQIDIEFGNGNKLRFCFCGLVFDPRKIDCEDCPNHQTDIAYYDTTCTEVRGRL